MLASTPFGCSCKRGRGGGSVAVLVRTFPQTVPEQYLPLYLFTRNCLLAAQFVPSVAAVLPLALRSVQTCRL